MSILSRKFVKWHPWNWKFSLSIYSFYFFAIYSLYIFVFFFFFASVDHFSFGEFLLLCIHYRQRVAFNSINKHCTRFETTINDAPRGFAVHDRHHYQLLSDSPIIGNNNSFWRLVQRLYRPHTLQSNLLQWFRLIINFLDSSRINIVIFNWRIYFSSPKNI